MDQTESITMPEVIFTYRGKQYGYRIQRGEPVPYLIEEDPEMTPEMEAAIDRMFPEGTDSTL